MLASRFALLEEFMIRSLLGTAIFGVCLMAVGCDTGAATGVVPVNSTGTSVVQQLKSDKAKKESAGVQVQGGGSDQPKK